MMRAAMILAAAIALSACAGKPPVETVVPPEILLTCKAAPAAPTTATRQSEVAGYIVRLHAAGQDCRDKLAAVRSLYETETEK